MMAAEPTRRREAPTWTALAAAVAMLVGACGEAASSSATDSDASMSDTSVSDTSVDDSVAAPTTGELTDASNNAPSNTTHVERVAAAPARSTGCSVRYLGPAGPFRHVASFGGIERVSMISVPTSYREGQPAPLVVNLHGFGHSTLSQEEISDANELAGARGYIVVTPQGAPISLPAEAGEAASDPLFADRSWWNFFGSSGLIFRPDEEPPDLSADDFGLDDRAFLTGLLDDVSGWLCVDLDRVYVMGLSNGAGMADTLACEFADRFAAVGAVAGVNLSGICDGEGAVSVIAIHGDADGLVPYDGGELVGFEVDNPSVPERIEMWAQRDGCAAPRIDAGPEVTWTRWRDCRAGTEVVLVTMHGFDHGWPTGDGAPLPGPVHATEVLLDFFDAHSREERST